MRNRPDSTAPENRAESPRSGGPDVEARSDMIPATSVLLEITTRNEEMYGKLSWVSRYAVVPVAIHLTRWLLRHGWRGDQVTLLMTTCAFAGPAFFLFGGAVGYVCGALSMLLSFVLDHSDGQVRRYRGEDSNLGIYLDRFTHRVSYPLQHIAIGVSLASQTGHSGYFAFGCVVAYFYQLVVAHSLDKQIIDIERGRVDRDPFKTLRLACTRRVPVLKWPLKVLLGIYFQLIQNFAFMVLLIPASLAGLVVELYTIYGTIVIANWLARATLDYTIVFPVPAQGKCPAIPDTPALRTLVTRDPALYGKAPWINERLILPHVAIHFTRLFLRLGWTGLQVSFLMSACAIGGALLFFVGGSGAYLAAVTLLILSYVLDRSDGQVRRFRGENSELGIYLDRFTHRVSYPLQHLGLGYSLAAQSGNPLFILFGGIVAYFYQLVVVQGLDKQIISLQRGGVDVNPIKTLRLWYAERYPSLALPLKVVVGLYSQLIQNLSFLLLMIPAVLLGFVAEVFVGYGGLIMVNWLLRTVLDYSVVFPWKTRYEAPQGSLRDFSPGGA